MKIAIRRIGNSLGIILPKSTLDAHGLREGSHVELSGGSIRLATAPSSAHGTLDEHKLRLAAKVASQFTPQLIRAHSLANLQRWRSSGAWVSAYEEWQQLLERGSDGELFVAMLGRDGRANRLRQSAPYVGLLSREEVKTLNEEAAG